MIIGSRFADVYVTCLFFFFNATATTEIYTLSLHDALPISARGEWGGEFLRQNLSARLVIQRLSGYLASRDRKSTRLNSSHLGISYAVFCLKKKIKDAEDKITMT